MLCHMSTVSFFSLIPRLTFYSHPLLSSFHGGQQWLPHRTHPASLEPKGKKRSKLQLHSAPSKLDLLPLPLYPLISLHPFVLTNPAEAAQQISSRFKPDPYRTPPPFPVLLCGCEQPACTLTAGGGRDRPGARRSPSPSSPVPTRRAAVAVPVLSPAHPVPGRRRSSSARSSARSSPDGRPRWWTTSAASRILLELEAGKSLGFPC